MKKIVEKLNKKLRSINLTLPLLGIVAAMAVIIVLLANYYGYIKIAGLQNWTQKKNVVTEQPKPEEKTTVETPTEDPAPTTPVPTTPAPQPSITLTATAYATGVKLVWTPANMDTSKGFKIVKSVYQNPVYPGNNYIYISQSAARSYAWEIKDGKTYYFRVCQYTGGACGIYSNNAKATAPYVATTPPLSAVRSITLQFVSLSPLSFLKEVVNETYVTPITGQTAKVSWVVDGYSAKGFKIVWSKNPGPTYPTRSGDKYYYDGSPSANTYGGIDPFSGSGDYYVRVCEYLGGACGVYSNEIKVTLP